MDVYEEPPQAIVLDVGSGMCKAGFAGDDGTLCKFVCGSN
jgi:actin-related protein